MGISWNGRASRGSTYPLKSPSMTLTALEAMLPRFAMSPRFSLGIDNASLSSSVVALARSSAKSRRVPLPKLLQCQIIDPGG